MNHLQVQFMHVRKWLEQLFDEPALKAWHLFAAFVAIAYISSSAFISTNGGNTFRQADAYSQILGFSGHTDFKPLDLFEIGQERVFDIPLYQAIIGSSAKILHIDPLVLCRFFNLCCLALACVTGYRMCSRLVAPLAGSAFVLILCTSRLFEHYFASPLPDDLSIALSLLTANLLTRHDITRTQALQASIAVSIAALIKSPIPFVFLVFSMVWWMLDKSPHPTLPFKRITAHRAIVLGAALTSAVLAEQMRMWLLGSGSIGFAQDPIWYFGPLKFRFEWEFWDRLIGRLFSFSSQLFLPATLFFLAAAASKRNALAPVRPILLASLAAYFAGWLVFSNVYHIHDYYTMPAEVMATILAATLFNQAHATQQKSERRRLLAAINAAFGLAILFASIRLIYYPISERSRASFGVTAEYMLKNKPYFVQIKNPGNDPSIAGTMSKRYIQILESEASQSCEKLGYLHDAFLVGKSHPCVSVWKRDAVGIIDGPGDRVLIIRR